MDLPPPLRPWAPSLSLFPRDLALSLGPLLRRLSVALGPMRIRHRADEGECDGFDGLTRRGTYERLLMSEWLLADEVPDEFLRRAVTGEHTFLRLAHPSPAGSGAAVTLFDAGPSQLGRPRIVHIAALIVMARRAEEAGAPFAWGVLQDPEGPLFPGVTPAGVLSLLNARTTFEATPGHLEAWARRIGDWKALDDLWVVGAPRETRLPTIQRASRLRPSEVVDVGGRRVAVTMTRRAAVARIELELPPDADCTRLLRDPFRVTVAPRRVAAAVFSPQSNLVFSPTGTRLLARSRLGGIVVYPIPHSPRQAVASPKMRLEGTTVAAVGGDGPYLVLAVACEGGVDLNFVSPSWEISRGGRYLSSSNEPFRAPDAATPLRPCLFGCRGLPLEVVRGLIVDAEGSLYDMTDGNRLIKRASRVSAITTTASGVAFVGQPAPGGDWRLVMLTAGGASLLPLEGDAIRAFFGFGGRFSHPEHGLLAVPSLDSSHQARVEPEARNWWTIRDAMREQRVYAHGGTRVVGVTRSSRTMRREEVGLVILEEDGRSLSFVARDYVRRLTTAPARIEHAVLSPTAANVAYSTERGDVFVYSLRHEAHLYRLFSENG